MKGVCLFAVSSCIHALKTAPPSNSAVVVTGFWPVKMKWGDEQQSRGLYLHDMQPVLNLPAKLVVWGDENGFQAMQKTRERSQRPFYAHHNVEVKDLQPCSKNWDRISQHPDQYTSGKLDLTGESQHKTGHPLDVPSIELGCIWDAKLDLLRRTKQLHPNFEWFIWLDAGFHGHQDAWKVLNNYSNNEREWPRPEKLAHLQKGKLLYATSSPFYCKGWTNCHDISGTALIVHGSVVDQLADLFNTFQQQCMEEATQKWVCLSDQIVLTQIMYKHPELFMEIGSAGGMNIVPLS